MKSYNYQLILILIFSFTVIVSCDCFRHGDGVVVDYYTGKPIDSVLVEAFLVNNDCGLFIGQTYTDSMGRFEVGTGNLPKSGCKDDFIVVFSKKGYKTIVAVDPHNVKITLDKSKLEREYLERIYKR